MKRKTIVLFLVLFGLIYGIGAIAMKHFAADKTTVTATPAGRNVAGYGVGERLQSALPKAKQTPAAPAAFEETSWFALIPKGWEPMKTFNDNMAKLNDADPRAMEALRKLNEEWDNAPTEPSMDGARIRIPGFVVPLDSERGKVKEFLLVPYFGACIHTPPPPANQIIHVFANKPLKNVQTMDAVWVSGVLEVARSRNLDNAKGLVGGVGYQMKAEIVTPYKEKPM